MSAHDLEFTSHMRPATRIFIFVAGLIPLLAPYELLFKPNWNTFVSPFFFLSLLISLGAVVVTVFFLAAAVLGLNEVIRFNAVQREVTYGFGAPLLKWREKRVPFAEIRKVYVETQTWSEGPDTYILRLDTPNGRAIRFGTFASVENAEKTRAKVHTILGLS
jgi:hypothetical protein